MLGQPFEFVRMSSWGLQTLRSDFGASSGVKEVCPVMEIEFDASYWRGRGDGEL